MLRRMHVLAVIAVAVVGVAGCGNDTSSPTAPEDTVPPAAVTGLTAVPHALGDPYVSLSWNAGSEPDLVGYRVYRTENRDATGSTKRGSTRIDNVALDTLVGTSFVDENVSMGTTYMYVVTAVDQAGNESPRALASVSVAPPVDRDPGDGID